jgi:ribosomal protein S18 acetylase RimI-like enzyme
MIVEAEEYETMTQTLELTGELEMPAGYTWRPATLDDVPALFATLQAVNQAEQLGMHSTEADLAREFDDPWSDPATDSLVGLAPDGTLAILGRTYVNPSPVPRADERRAFWDLDVHPAHRNFGLEAPVLAWLEARARQKLAAVAASHPAPAAQVLRTGTPASGTERRRLLEQHGYSIIRRFYRMLRDLALPIPPVTLPEGVRLRRFTPADSQPAWEVFNQAFSDHWGYEPMTRPEWDNFIVGRSSFRPDLTWLAFAGDEVVAISINRIEQEVVDGAFQPVGWVGSLGVVRAWRKRGLATALLCQSMRAFAHADLDTAGLGVDSENVTGALAIYERLDFKVARESIAYQKEA